MSIILAIIAAGFVYCVSIESKNIEPPTNGFNRPEDGQKHRP